MVFSVGGSPLESPQVSVTLKSNFNEMQQARIKIFYCPGGLNYKKINLPMKIMLKLFAHVLAKKKDATEIEKAQAEMIKHSYDLSDKKYIEPIIAYLKA